MTSPLLEDDGDDDDDTVEPLYNGHLWEQCFGLYTEVAFVVERLFCTQTVHLGPGCLAVI